MRKVVWLPIVYASTVCLSTSYNVFLAHEERRVAPFFEFHETPLLWDCTRPIFFFNSLNYILMFPQVFSSCSHTLLREQPKDVHHSSIHPSIHQSIGEIGLGMGVQRVHANDAYCMFFLIAQNLYILFYKIYRFTTLFSFKLSLLLNLRFLLLPILTMMQLRIILYTYCTPLQSCTAISIIIHASSIVHA